MRNILIILCLLFLNFNLSSSEEKISKKALHKIDDLLLKRMFIIKKNIKEDKSFANQAQYIITLDNKIKRSEAFIDYFRKKLRIAKSIKDETSTGYKELEALSKKYTKGIPGYQIVNTFKDYFHAYKCFAEAAHNDLEDKIKASLLYKVIAQLEMNQKIFFVSLEQSKIQEAKKLLNTEDKLIKDYNQNIKKIHFEYRIPDKWKQKIRIMKDYIKSSY